MKRYNFYSTLSIICGTCSGILLCLGFYKMYCYSNTDYSYVNAYVGGDCYNYIINGTYAIAYFVLAMMTTMMAFEFKKLKGEKE